MNVTAPLLHYIQYTSSSMLHFCSRYWVVYYRGWQPMTPEPHAALLSLCHDSLSLSSSLSTYWSRVDWDHVVRQSAPWLNSVAWSHHWKSYQKVAGNVNTTLWHRYVTSLLSCHKINYLWHSGKPFFEQQCPAPAESLMFWKEAFAPHRKTVVLFSVHILMNGVNLAAHVHKAMYTNKRVYGRWKIWFYRLVESGNSHSQSATYWGTMLTKVFHFFTTVIGSILLLNNCNIMQQ